MSGSAPGNRWLNVSWLLPCGAAIWLVVLNWHWLHDHGQALLVVVVLLGLIAGVFPLAKRIASSKEISEASERLKLQNEIRGAVFQALAGLAVLVGVFIAWQQLQSDRAQSQATNTLASQGQISQAVGELGSPQIDVRTGGIYALEEIFKLPNQNPNQRPTNPVIIRVRPAVFGVLTAYIRTHAPWASNPRVCDVDPKLPTLAVRALDVQAALNVLGSRGYGAPTEPSLFLEQVDLRNADFYRSFDDTDFARAELAGANFHNASLVGASFEGADLCGAKLATVTDFHHADFQGAIANTQTTFPPGFDPKAHGIIVRP
jgi:hypothetical protein